MPFRQSSAGESKETVRDELKRRECKSESSQDKSAIDIRTSLSRMTSTMLRKSSQML